MTENKPLTPTAESIIENIIHTVLYEGYSLYPYHRTAIKNQKPIPFGVVYPQSYNSYNPHAGSVMQTQCIVTGDEPPELNISVRFLRLKRIELFLREFSTNSFTPASTFTLEGQTYEAGWQTTEVNINPGNLPITQLVKPRVIGIDIAARCRSENIYDHEEILLAEKRMTEAELAGMISIVAEPLKQHANAFRITVEVTNTSAVEHPEEISRDDIFPQSFLSTNIILRTPNGRFISHQNPGEEWIDAIADCENKNAWPILVEETGQSILASPIILYDYPKINPGSRLDLFDSTEIQEALLLHVNLLSDAEKEQIAAADEKLRAMLNKVSQVTPEELLNIHSGLRNTGEA